MHRHVGTSVYIVQLGCYDTPITPTPRKHRTEIAHATQGTVTNHQPADLKYRRTNENLGNGKMPFFYCIEIIVGNGSFARYEQMLHFLQ